MKNIHLFDTVFILVSCVIFIGFDYLGYSETLSRFSYLILITGYFLGKFVSKYYQSKNKELSQGEFEK